MCTAATYQTKDFYFGRTLDYEFSYGEEVVITPRNYELRFREKGEIKSHYAIIGMAHVIGDYPLYYDAVNEKGLCIAGLNFVGNAYYGDVQAGKDNIAQYELIPWILGKCGSVGEVRELLRDLNIINVPFHEKLPVAQLHYMISDCRESVTLEAVADGLHVYDNPVGVLTNNPPFPMQMFHLNNYRHLSVSEPENTFSENLDLKCYSRGMGAIGLPGDLSSMSRFVRVAFTKLHSKSEETEKASVSQFFHILGSVDQQRGCCKLKDDEYEITIYTSCCNASKGIYYYTTYDNHQIIGVDMHREDIESMNLIRYPLITEEPLRMQN